MPGPSDHELTERWRREPAPLLPLLHAFHDRDGYLSDEALAAAAQALDIPLAELFGTASFYHHFSRSPGGRDAPRVCTGPVCALRGGEALQARLAARGAVSMPCAGRCDAPVPVLSGDQVLADDGRGNLFATPSLLPPPNPGGTEECVFAQIRTPGRSGLAGYRQSGGYAGLERALSPM